MGFDFSDLPTRDGMYLRDALQGEFTDVDEDKRQVQVTFPHDTVDTYKTTFGKDAFRDSFEKRKPLMCWQHDLRDPIGHAISAQVTAKSNELIGQFSDFDAVPNAKRAFSQIDDGTITDFSFGFRQPKYENHPKHAGVRNIRSAQMMEFSPVSIGSIPGAIATGLREEDFMAEHSAEEIARLVEAKLISVEEGQRMLATMPEFREHITIKTAEQKELDELRAFVRAMMSDDREPGKQVYMEQSNAVTAAGHRVGESAKIQTGDGEGPDSPSHEELQAKLAAAGHDTGNGGNIREVPNPLTADDVLAALPENYQRAIFEAKAVFAIAPEGTEFFRSDDVDTESASSIATAIEAAHNLATDWIKDTDVRALPEEVQQAIQLWNAAGSSTEALLDVLGIDGSRALPVHSAEPIGHGSEDMAAHPVKCLLCAGSGETEDGKTCPQCGGSGQVAMTRAAKPAEGVTCAFCKGHGKDSDGTQCSHCGGKGWMNQDDTNAMTNRSVPDDAPEGAKGCPTCDGSGKIHDGHMKCPDCHGKGWQTREEQDDVEKRSDPEGWSEKPWSSFKQSSYSPEEWRRACLIVEGDGSSKGQCKLPVREPDGTYNVHGISAAAGRLNQTDASSEDKASAAHKLAGLYGQLKRDVPPEVSQYLNRDDHKDVIAEDAEAIRQAALERLNRRVPAGSVAE